MSDTWYYADKQRPVGPLSLPALKAGIQKSPNWQELLVWRDGFPDWQRADSVKEILALFVMPPPIPAASVAGSAAPARINAPLRTIAAIVLGLLVLAGAVVTGAYWQAIVQAARDFTTPPPPLTSVSSDLEKSLSDAALKIRAGLPRRIDATTTLVAVKSEATKLIYENSVAMDGAKFDEAMKNTLRKTVTRNLCGMADTRRVLELGGSFRYSYDDIDAKRVLTIDIARQNCT